MQKIEWSLYLLICILEMRISMNIKLSKYKYIFIWSRNAFHWQLYAWNIISFRSIYFSFFSWANIEYYWNKTNIHRATWIKSSILWNVTLLIQTNPSVAFYYNWEWILLPVFYNITKVLSLNVWYFHKFTLNWHQNSDFNYEIKVSKSISFDV